MIISFLSLVLLILYLYKIRQIHLVLVIASILPQYHFRYWLYNTTGFSNYTLVYGEIYNAHIDEVNNYLNLLFVTLSIFIFIYTYFLGRRIKLPTTNNRLDNSNIYALLIIILFLYAVFYRISDRATEENFSTVVLALLMATFAYASSYIKTSNQRLFILLFSGATAVLIGFKSLILILLISITFGLTSLNYWKILIYMILTVTLMLIASILRGVEANIINALLSLATSHYDSWSFLIIAFGEEKSDFTNNFSSWLESFLTLIPGLSSYFQIQTYGHYLNLKYTDAWFNHTSVLLAPGIIGELWSLAIWSPFIFLPLIIIGYDVLYKVLGRSGAPMRIILLSMSIFLLEAPLSNLGQLVKILIVAIILGKLLGLRKSGHRALA